MKAGTLDALICSRFLELLYIKSLTLFIILQTGYNYTQDYPTNINALSTMCSLLALAHVVHNQLLYNLRLWLKRGSQGRFQRMLTYWIFDVYNIVLLRKKDARNSLEMRLMAENWQSPYFMAKWALFTVCFIGTIYTVQSYPELTSFSWALTAFWAQHLVFLLTRTLLFLLYGIIAVDNADADSWDFRCSIISADFEEVSDLY